MKIRDDADLSRFIEAVPACRGQIYFDTPEGDHLNLKSALSQFVFLRVVLDKSYRPDGSIHCTDDSDYTLLSAFLTE